MTATRCWSPPDPTKPLEPQVEAAVAAGALTRSDADELLRFGAFLQQVPRAGTVTRRERAYAMRRALFATYPETSETEARMVVRERSNGRCELDVRDVCRGRAAEWSHRQRRGQGGLWTPCNGLDACSACHRWLGAHPTWADAAGLTLPSYVTDPGAVPAYVSWHGLARSWWHLNLDGTLTACHELERAPWRRGATPALDCSGACVRPGT